MKTTLDIPDQILHEAKMAAARERTTLRCLVTRALEVELARRQSGPLAIPGWRKAFGTLRHLRSETAGVDAAVNEVFEQIDEDTWR